MLKHISTIVLQSLLSLKPWSLKFMNQSIISDDKINKVTSKCNDTTTVVLSVLLAVFCSLFIMAVIAYIIRKKRSTKGNNGFNLRRLSNGMQSVTSNE